jgi:flagellar hook protein FlgE
MGFQQGLSGLSVSARNLEVIGNNVANANTFGAKASRAEFADVYAKALNGAGSSQAGIGARVAAVAQQFTQGNITTTENPLDLAVNGDGFFKVQRWDENPLTGELFKNGPELYTRNGQFKLDKQGYLVNNEGHRLLGQMPGSTGDGDPLKLGLSGGSAQPTSIITAKFNLNASEPVPAASAPIFNPTDTTTYGFSTTQTVYDESGETVPLQYYFRKTATDEWNVYVAANGQMLNSDYSVQPPTYNQVATVTFPSSGKAPTRVVDYNGVDTGDNKFTLPTIAAGLSSTTQSEIAGVRVDFSNFTQYAGKSAVNDLYQNGYAKGDFSSFSVDSSGAILVRYTNGQTVNEGQLYLARFNNPQGLQPEGGNEWSVTAASGAAQTGIPGSGKLGLLQGGALEESNVDLTGELVSMIVAQRMYQANAQTIKAEDQVLQTLVNLR